MFIHTVVLLYNRVMALLPYGGSKYDDDTRAAVIGEYAVKGVYAAVGRALSIPPKTVSDMVKSDWGQAMLAEVRRQNGDRFIATSQEIIDRATERTLETIEDADCRTAATVGAIYYDKLRLALNQPTSIRGDSASLQSLANEFRRIAQDNRNITESVVSVQPGPDLESE
jgi:hypothetical protein